MPMLILSDNQFGFYPNQPTYVAIIQFVDKVTSTLEQNETTIGIFFDLSKAFDIIDHSILLYKLERYGFRGILLDWFKNYLSYRKPYESLNSCESEQKDIVCGVPQGFILGPFLFILYVNDITITSDVLEFVLFVNDTSILYSHSNIENQINLINEELNEVSN